MRLVSAGMAHPGKKRAHNEDAFLLDDGLGLYAVADGVESEAAGEVASQLALAALAKFVRELTLDEDATPPFEHAEGIPLAARALKFCIREVNRVVYKKAHSDPKLAGMSTTLTAAWRVENRLFIANVGDSRFYMIRRGQIHQLTHDHTAIALTHSGQSAPLDDVDVFSSVSEHALTRAIGVNPDVEVQLVGGSPRPNDLLLLCTDGLYTGLSEFEILSAVENKAPDVAVKALVNLANQRGGLDNVAVIVVKIVND